MLGNRCKRSASTCALALPLSNLTICPDQDKSTAEMPGAWSRGQSHYLPNRVYEELCPRSCRTSLKVSSFTQNMPLWFLLSASQPIFPIFPTAYHKDEHGGPDHWSFYAEVLSLVVVITLVISLVSGERPLSLNSSCSMSEIFSLRHSALDFWPSQREVCIDAH